MQSEEKGEGRLSLRPQGQGKLSSYKKALWDLLGPTEATGPLLYRSHWEDVHAVSSTGLKFIYLSRRLCEPSLSQQTDGSREPVPRRMSCDGEGGTAGQEMCWLESNANAAHCGCIPGKPLTQSVLSFLVYKTRILMLDPGTVISEVISQFWASWSQPACVPRSASFACSVGPQWLKEKLLWGLCFISLWCSRGKAGYWY